ncbi:MAG: hypothetical protein PW786_01680, partial [Arachidicoccus sp.]|nr:hypothetical protein [Arachidicoccus sp.]
MVSSSIIASYRSSVILIYILFATMLFGRCSKLNATSSIENNKGNVSNTINFIAPSVIIDSVYNITSTGAYIAAHVYNKGSSNVVARGVIFSKDSLFSQTLDTVKASNVFGDGRFICQLSGIDFEQIYYLKAYASNSETTGLSSQTSFAALSLQNVTYNKKPIFIVGNTTASIDIQIVADRGIEISERGLVYGTSSDIKNMDHKVMDKSGKG